MMQSLVMLGTTAVFALMEPLLPLVIAQKQFIAALDVTQPHGLLLDGPAIVSEGDAGSDPAINITILIAPESAVCPHGYRPYGAQQLEDGENCAELQYPEDIEALKRQYPGWKRVSVPPSTIEIGSEMRSLLYEYQQKTSDGIPRSPGDRAAVVFVFEWWDRHDLPITLTRSQVEGAARDIVSRQKENRGNENLHWIDHQRADALYPSNKVQWDLTVGEYKWRLKTW